MLLCAQEEEHGTRSLSKEPYLHTLTVEPKASSYRVNCNRYVSLSKPKPNKTSQ